MITAIIVAAGQSRRMLSQEPKVLLRLGGHPVLAYSLSCFARLDEVDGIILVVSPQVKVEMEKLASVYGQGKVREVVLGGETRQQSVKAGLAALSDSCDLVLVHDGARPCILDKDVKAVVARAKETGAAILATPVKDTIKLVKDGVVQDTPDRQLLWAAQTPQVFSRGLLEEAYRKADENGVLATDDASLVAALGSPVHVVRGSYQNIKVTTPEDILVVETLIKQGGLTCL